MTDRDILFERMRGAKTIIPAMSGYDNARRKALEIAAYMEIVEGKPISEKEFMKMYNEFRNDPDTRRGY